MYIDRQRVESGFLKNVIVYFPQKTINRPTPKGCVIKNKSKQQLLKVVVIYS